MSVAVIWTVIALWFNYRYGTGAFQRDYFRHFHEIIIPLLSGEGGLAHLFHNHHPSPLLHFHQLVSTLLFGGSLRLDAYAGILALCCLALCLAVPAFRELSARSHSTAPALLVAVTMVFLITGPSSPKPLQTPLIYLQAYWFLLGLAVAWSTWSLVSEPDRPRRALVYVVVAALAIILHTSYGLMFFIATVPALLRHGIARPRLVLPLLAAVTFAWLWKSAALPALGHESRGPANLLQFFVYHMNALPLFVAAFGKSLLGGFLGTEWSWGHDSQALTLPRYALFFAAAAVYAAVACRAVLSRRRVMLAGIFLWAVALGTLAVLLTRGAVEFPYNLDTSRYTLLYQVGAAAFTWAAADALVSLWARRQAAGKAASPALPALVCAVLCMPVLAAQLAAFDAVRSKKHELATYRANAGLLVYMAGTDDTNTFPLRDFPGGGGPKAKFERVIEWLRAHRLNVFDEEYHASRLLRDFKRAAAAFEASRSPPRSLRARGTGCAVLPKFDRPVGWQAVVRSRTGLSRVTLQRRGVDGRRDVYYAKKGRSRFYGTLEPGSSARLCVPRTAALESLSYVPMPVNPA